MSHEFAQMLPVTFDPLTLGAGIPIMATTAERDATFPIPSLDQRVWNRETQNQERWNGLAWVIDFSSPFNPVDSIPVVLTTAARDLLFPTPSTNQRVFNAETGRQERYNGTVWVIDFPWESMVGNALVPGVWYPAGRWRLTGGVQHAINILRAVPFEKRGGPFTIDRLAFNITSIGGATSRVRIGIYRAANGIGLPTTLLIDAGEENTDGGAADTRAKTFSPITLVDPLYWFVYIAGVSATAPTVRSVTTGDADPVFGVSATDLGTASKQTHLTVAQAYGALPGTFPGGAVFGGDNYPVIACRGV